MLVDYDVMLKSYVQMKFGLGFLVICFVNENLISYFVLLYFSKNKLELYYS